MNLEIKHLWSHKCPKKWDQYTLVALVITIIILLILAGVAIAQLTDSGLFGKAKLAKEKAKTAQDLENSILGDYENQIAMNSRETITISKSELQTLIDQSVSSALANYVTQDQLTALQGSGSGSGTSITKLWSADSIQASGTITLSDSIENYKFLIVNASSSTNIKNNSIVISKDDFVIDDTKTDRYEIDGYDTRYINFCFKSNTVLEIAGQSYLGLKSIYGVN